MRLGKALQIRCPVAEVFSIEYQTINFRGWCNCGSWSSGTLSGAGNDATVHKRCRQIGDYLDDLDRTASRVPRPIPDSLCLDGYSSAFELRIGSVPQCAGRAVHHAVQGPE